MYEYLLKWGLNTLTKAVDNSEKHEKSIVLEAIKAKNSLVIERFKHAYSTSYKVIELTIKLDDDLSDFQKNKSEKNIQVDKFIKQLKREFHPKYFREFRRLRSHFDSTNDLLCAYSMLLINWIQFDNIEKIMKEVECTTPSDVTRIYRIMWNYVASILTKLIRTSANDLRFWLTDSPYVIKATDWGKNDFVKLKNYILNYDENNFFYLSFEEPEGQKSFWDSIEYAG